MKPHRYPKPNATSKAATEAVQAYYRMIDAQNSARRISPPMGFDALRRIAAGKPVDQEAEAERAALRCDP